MKWRTPNEFEQTVETVFLFFPMVVNGEVRWWERVHVLGRWMMCRGGWLRFYPERFVSPDFVIPDLSIGRRRMA